MLVEHFTDLSISQLIDMYEAEQEAQGRRRNYRVLLNNPWVCSMVEGGISWQRTVSGHAFWHTLLIETNFVDIIRDLGVTYSCPKCGEDVGLKANREFSSVIVHEGCCHFTKDKQILLEL